MTETKKTTTSKSKTVKITEDVAPVKETNAYGIIIDCERLRLRSTAKIADDNIIGEIQNGEKFLIDLNESVKNFYKISTASGLEGFVSKTFVEIK